MVAMILHLNNYLPLTRGLHYAGLGEVKLKFWCSHFFIFYGVWLLELQFASKVQYF